MDMYGLLNSSSEPARKFLSYEEKEFYLQFLRASASAVFCNALTFKYWLYPEEAVRKFAHFIAFESRRHYQSENIGYIYGLEQKLSFLSDCESRPHIHAVLISNAQLVPDELRQHWSRIFGGCRIEPYDFNKDGIGYALKCSAQSNCEIGLSSNLYVFQPGYKPKNKHQRQVIRRHQERRERRRPTFLNERTDTK
jgi:hypothetical protein